MSYSEEEFKNKNIKKYFLVFTREFWETSEKASQTCEDNWVGRLEIRPEGDKYAMDEIRVFTKDNKEFDKFRGKWDFNDVNSKDLDKVVEIVKNKYQKN